MLKNKISGALIIQVSLVFFFISCDNQKLNFREIIISSAPYIKSDALNLKDFSVDYKPDPGSRLTLNIIIYSFSSGKETIRLAEDGSFITETGASEIKALLKIMDGEKLVKADFAEVSGENNNELLRNLAGSVTALCGRK